MLALPLVLSVWMEIGYRLYLFQRYGCRPYVNHVDDGYFVGMHVLAGVAGLLLAAGLVPAIRAAAFGRTILHAALLACAAAGALTLIDLHDRALLVTYGEWARQFGP